MLVAWTNERSKKPKTVTPVNKHARDQQTVVLLHRWSSYEGVLTWRIYPWDCDIWSIYISRRSLSTDGSFEPVQLHIPWSQDTSIILDLCRWALKVKTNMRNSRTMWGYSSNGVQCNVLCYFTCTIAAVIALRDQKRWSCMNLIGVCCKHTTQTMETVIFCVLVTPGT